MVDSQKVIEYLKADSKHIKDGLGYTCENRAPNADPSDPMQFMPVYSGLLNSENTQLVILQGRCFRNITMTYKQFLTPDNELEKIEITAVAEDPVNYYCKDWFVFWSPQFAQFDTMFFRGTHTITIAYLRQGAIHDINVNGVKVYMFCHGYTKSLLSLGKTALAFLGGLTVHPTWPVIGSHVPWYMETLNKRIMEVYMNWNVEERTESFYDYEETDIKSGDVLAIFRMDGVD